MGGPEEKTVQIFAAPDGGIIIIDEDALQCRVVSQIEDGTVTEFGINTVDAEAQPKKVGLPFSGGSRSRSQQHEEENEKENRTCRNPAVSG